MDKEALLAKINKLTRLQKILIAVGSCLLVAAAMISLLLLPNFEDVDKLSLEVKNLDDSIQARKIDIARMSKLEAEFEAKTVELAFAQSLIPDDPQKVEGLLASIESAGREIGVEFLSFVPSQTETKLDFYATRRVQLRLLGRFHDLMRFFDRLTKLDRLASLEQFSLKPQPGPPSPDGVTLNCDSSLLIYRILAPSEIEQPKPQPKKK